MIWTQIKFISLGRSLWTLLPDWEQSLKTWKSQRWNSCNKTWICIWRLHQRDTWGILVFGNYPTSPFSSLPSSHNHWHELIYGQLSCLFLCYSKPVGCDHLMYSRKKFDRCGKCGGKADSCKDEMGSFTEKIKRKNLCWFIFFFLKHWWWLVTNAIFERLLPLLLNIIVVVWIIIIIII